MMGKRTVLYQEHLKSHALMVEFGGWEMPLHYGSQIAEHNQVRQSAGMFDVSHMGVIDIKGPQTQVFLRYLLANNIDKLKEPGKALYGCMLKETGGVIDDLITYFVSPEYYRLVVNAATYEKDLQWIRAQAKAFDVSLHALQDYAMIAVQGPEAIHKMGIAFPKLKHPIQALKSFQFIEQEGWFIARTGYTGEEGIEMILPGKEAAHAWNALAAEGVLPCGLGARDTLRLEAGFNLYGQDMDESVTPLESNLSWTLAFNARERNFIGRSALEAQKNHGIPQQLVGIVLEDKGVLRHDQKIFSYTTDMNHREEVGFVTSGSFSPSLKQSIGFARIKTPTVESQEQMRYCVEIRDKPLKVHLVQPPFFRRPK
jgi:aminomethyltransferase